MNRKLAIERLKTERFDVCIIGAGASGAGCALDAALRGLKVALIEKTDFAGETSSKSTKLAHGGVRYLEQAFKNFDWGQLKQVRHGLVERHSVLNNAPHLARPLGLITPVFSWVEGLYFTIGLRLYGWFASSRDKMPASRWLSRDETLKRMPGLNKRIHSAVLYYDGQLDDARYCVALSQSAYQAGAAVANHLALTGFEKNENGQLKSAQVWDKINNTAFSIHADSFLNCTGAFADEIRRLANAALARRINPSKGVHAVLPLGTLGSRDAMLIPKTKDGRVVFAVPFEGTLMVGTTDDPYLNMQEEPVLNREETTFLLETLNRFLEKPVSAGDIRAGFGGLRPLVLANSEVRSTKTMLRDHEVEIDPKSGLLSLLGGKWTTYRLMAQDAVDALCKKLGISKPCLTLQHRLYGAEGYHSALPELICKKSSLSLSTAEHLAAKYGVNAWKVLQIGAESPDLLDLLHPEHPYIAAEVVYTARAEMACTPRDFLARRIRLELCDWAATFAIVDRVSTLMQAELNWSDDQRENYARTYKNQILQFQRAVSQHP